MSETPRPEFRWLESGTGEPVVLLHGLLGDMHQWEASMESLAEVCGMTDVTLVRMTQALDHVCVEHGLPSIAWNPIRGKSSFALRLMACHP